MSGSILVVEDETDLGLMIQDALHFDGYEAAIADHPEEVRSVLREAQPDLFLIDIMLPQTSGIELAQCLRSSGYADTPMIGMSASKMMVQIAAQSGAFTDVIDKPFEINDLLSRVERYLSGTTAAT